MTRAEFKLQKVKLYENGKPRAEIAKEYELTIAGLRTTRKLAHSQQKIIVLKKKMS